MIDPAPIFEISKNAHHTATVRQLDLCNSHYTIETGICN